jgi:hypothetical protein
MTAVSDRKAEEVAPRCAQCGAACEFGYGGVYRAMHWFCARHRLGQHWADARTPAIVTNNRGPRSIGSCIDDTAARRRLNLRPRV